MSRFTRIAVRKNSKSTSFVVGYIGSFDPSGSPVLEMPGGITIPLRASMQAITANHQGSDSFRTEGGSVFSIAAKDVRTDRFSTGDGKRPVETVLEMLERNPWNNAQALKVAKALRG